jgi:hypothetical protein
MVAGYSIHLPIFAVYGIQSTVHPQPQKANKRLRIVKYLAADLRP